MKAKKKLSAFIIAVILMLNIISVVSADNEDGTFNMLSEFYMPGGDGVGFYDTATVDSPMEKKPEYWGHGGIILRPGEWIKYELPNNMKEGTYTLYLNMANYNPNQVSICINDSYGYHYVNIPESKGPDGEFDGSLMYYTQREIGGVFIGEGTNTLTVKACKDAFTLLDFTLVYKNGDEVYNIAHTNLYSCLNKGASGTENSTNPEIGYISGSWIDILPNKMLVMRPKSKFTFDISNFSQGTYNLSVKSASLQTQKVDLILSENADGTGNKSTTEAMLLSTGGWNSYARTVVLDKIFVAEDMNYLTIDVQSGASQLDYLIFEKISDNDISEIVIPYNNVISDEAGVGFYAGKDKTALESGIEGATDMAAIRGNNGYWVKYDISDIPAGTYTLSLNAASYLGTTAVDISVNNEVVLDDANIYSSGAYSDIKVPKKVAVGTITIPEITEENGKNTLTLKGVKNAFNLKSIILSKGPAVNVLYERGTTLDKTLTDTVAEGTMYFDAYPGVEFEGKTTLVVFAVYKTKNVTDVVSLDKVYIEVTDADKISGHVENITFEEGYTYTQKIFIWDNATLQGYSFK